MVKVSAYGDTVTSIAVERAKALLTLREGCRNDVYKDTRGILTVGIGHRVTPADNLEKGQIIPEDLIDELFNNDIQWALRAAQSQAVDLNIVCADMLAALISVCFQLGPKWNLPVKNGGKGFVRTWKLLKERRYTEAIANLRKSAWHDQTPVRVEDFIQSLQSVQKLFYHS